jgi:hypothetical protein
MVKTGKAEKIRNYLNNLKYTKVPVSEYKGAVMLLVYLGNYKYSDGLEMIEAYKDELMESLSD